MADDYPTNPTVQDTGSTGRDSVFASLSPAFLAVLRIGAGLLFMQHGAQKLFGLLTERPPVELFSLMGLAGVLEFFGGLLIVLGLFTVPVAVILTLEMLTAYFMAHMPREGFPVQDGGELPLLYALIFAFLAVSGPGPASLDRKFGTGWTD